MIVPTVLSLASQFFSFPLHHQPSVKLFVFLPFLYSIFSSPLLVFIMASAYSYPHNPSYSHHSPQPHHPQYQKQVPESHHQPFPQPHHDTFRDSIYSNTSNYTSHQLRDSVCSISSSIYSSTSAPESVLPVSAPPAPARSHPYNTLLSGATPGAGTRVTNATTTATTPSQPRPSNGPPLNHSRTISTIVVPPKSSLRLLQRTSLLQDEILEDPQESLHDSSYSPAPAPASGDCATISSASTPGLAGSGGSNFGSGSAHVNNRPLSTISNNPPQSLGSISSITTTNSAVSPNNSGLNISTDTHIAEYHTPPLSHSPPLGYAFDQSQLSARQLSFIQEFGYSPTFSKKEALNSKRQQSPNIHPRLAAAISKGHSSQMSLNMEEMVRQFERELSALDGYGEIISEASEANSSTTLSGTEIDSNSQSTPLKQHLDPSPLPDYSLLRSSPHTGHLSPASPNSSVENFSPITPKTPRSPANQLHSDSGSIRRKPSVIGKFRHFGKRIISGGASHVPSADNSPAADVSVEHPHASEKYKNHLINMKFSSENRS